MERTTPIELTATELQLLQVFAESRRASWARTVNPSQEAIEKTKAWTVLCEKLKAGLERLGPFEKE